MKVDIEMPNLGESIVEGTVVEWHKTVGERVEQNEELFTISTDKVDTGVPSPKAGKLVEIRADVDDVVQVGEIVAVIDTEATDAEAASTDQASSHEEAADSGQKSESSTNTDDNVRDDDAGSGGDETDETADAEETGAEDEASGQPDDDAADRDVRITPVARRLLNDHGITDFSDIDGSGSGGRIVKADAEALIERQDRETDDESSSAKADARDATDISDEFEDGASIAQANAEMAGRVPQATKELDPAVRERAARRERDEPPTQWDGQTEPSEQRPLPDESQGPLAIPRGMRASSSPRSEGGGDAASRRQVPPPPVHLLEQLKSGRLRNRGTPDIFVGRNDTSEPMTGLERSISRQMVQSRQSAAHCSTVWEADITKVVNLRAELRSIYKEKGVKLTYTPFFIAALADGLRRFPILNASVDGDDIVYRGDVNIGIATPWREGLVVPVIHKADFLNLFGLARAVNEINRRIREEIVRPSDVEHGTFSVTNTGIYGSLFSVPTIMQPQVGIMSIGRIAKRVKVEQDDTIRIRSTVHLGLTFDHRVVNFERADSFMRYVVNFLENWEAAG